MSIVDSYVTDVKSNPLCVIKSCA